MMQQRPSWRMGQETGWEMTSSFGIPDSAPGPGTDSQGSPGMVGPGAGCEVVEGLLLSVLREKWRDMQGLPAPTPTASPSTGPWTQILPLWLLLMTNQAQRGRWAGQGHPAPGPGYSQRLFLLRVLSPGSSQLKKELNGQRKRGTSQVLCGQVGTLPRELL